MRYCAGEEDTSNGITGAPAGGGLVLGLGGWVAWYWVGGWVALAAAAAAAAGKTCSARPLCGAWCRGISPRGPLPVGDCGVGVCSPPAAEG